MSPAPPISINSLPYRIVGVMADKNQNSSYSGMDEKKIWLPYTTMARDVPPTKYYDPGRSDEILYQPRSLEQFEEARKQVMRDDRARRTISIPRTTARSTSGTPSKTRNRWTASSIR